MSGREKGLARIASAVTQTSLQLTRNIRGRATSNAHCLCPIERLEPRQLLTTSIAGNAFNDANDNGTKDGGEAALVSWTVYADSNTNGAFDTGEPSTTTDSGGAYTLTFGSGSGTGGSSPSGVLRIVQQSGWRQTLPSSGYYALPTSGQTLTGKDFGETSKGKITGTVYNDANDNGANNSESGLSGWQVFDDANSNGVLDGGEPTATTDASGNYALNNLSNTCHFVRITQQAGWRLTAPTSGSYVLYVPGGTTSAGNDFGETGKGKVTGKVYNDANDNGVNNSESGLSGWQVYDDQNFNGILDGGEAAATTDASGNYTFNNLSNTCHFIRITQQAGWRLTAPTSGVYVLNVPGGTSSNGNDFGETGKGKISGKVFNDANDNASNDSEAGLSGWQVYIDANSNGVVDGGEASTTTDASGNYTLANVPTYTCNYLRVVQQTGWRLTLPTGGLYFVYLNAGQSATGYDFGETAKAKISGNVFNDANDNSTKDSGESNLMGWTVYYDMDSDGTYNTGDLSAITDGGGNYTINNVPASSSGSHYVRIVQQANWRRTLPSSVNSYAIAPVAGQNYSGYNFGQTQRGSISGKVFNDSNDNGTNDSESGLSGWQIYDDLNFNGTADAGEPSATTDGSGNYTLSNLSTGSSTCHLVRIVQQSAWRVTTASNYNVILSGGQAASGYNFGETQKGKISGIVYNDADGNGTKAAGEAVLPGWTVYLDANNNSALDAGEKSAVSGAGGDYAFNNLDTGSANTHRVRIVAQSAWRLTAPVGGVYVINLAGGESVSGKDFGETPINPDLQIFKPAVIDPAQPMIPDADELTVGSATFVNLDNDDADGSFDDSDTNVAPAGGTGGDDELVKVRLNVGTNNAGVNVRLVATAGATSIRVWRNSQKTAVYTLDTDIAVPTAGYVDLWVEGISPHSTQQETKLQMRCSASSYAQTDDAALTVIGISEVKWGGYDNAIDDSDTLTTDPNFPSYMYPEDPTDNGAHVGWQVFPDKRVFASPLGGFVQDPSPRNIVRTFTNLSVATPMPITIYLRCFDVDDPSSESSPVDNNPVGGPMDEALATDNRGSGQHWEVSHAGQADVTDLSFAAGESSKEVHYVVGMQPGNNYRLAANGDLDFVTALDNNDSLLEGYGATLEARNIDKQRIADPAVLLATNSPGAAEVRQARQYCSDTLTVWRFLHVERDSMAAVPSSGSESNVVNGNIGDVLGDVATGIATDINLPVNLATGLPSGADASANLNSTPVGNGRFENGTITIGSGSSTVATSALTGNGNQFVRKSAGMNIPFLIVLSGLPTISGNVVASQASTGIYTLNISSGTLTAAYNGGTLAIGGVGLAITNVNAPNNKVTAPGTIPFSLVDDDTAVLPSLPEFALMVEKYKPAYVLPVDDGGGNPSYNKATVSFTLNINSGIFGTEMDKPGAFESSNWRKPDYWIAYALGSYQGPANSDGDASSETYTEGITGGITGPKGRGSFICNEAIQDTALQAGWTAADQTLYLRRTLVHEIGHQFRLIDNPPGPGGIMTYASVNDLAHDVNFSEFDLDGIRSCLEVGR